MMMMTWQWTQEKKTEVLFLDYLGKIVKRRITSIKNSLSLTTKDVTTDASDVIVVRRSSKGGFFFLSFAFESSFTSSSSQSRRRKHAVPRFFCRSGGTIIIV